MNLHNKKIFDILTEYKNKNIDLTDSIARDILFIVHHNALTGVKYETENNI